MKRYDKLSKGYYIKIYTEYLAYEIYLDQKFHKEDNNSVEVIWNGCLDELVLTEKELENIIKNAKQIFEKNTNLI